MFLNRLLGTKTRHLALVSKRSYSSKKTIDESIGFLRKMDSNVQGSIKALKKHVMICDGPDSWETWSESIEKMSGVVGQISHHFRKDDDIRVIACDLPNSSKGQHDVLCYDATQKNMVGIRKITPENYDHVLRFISDDVIHPSVEVETLPLDCTYVLVCSHASRDKRCGYCGPIIANEILNYIDSHVSELKHRYVVTRVSHVGGHKYAANVIVYPHGDWYGYICPEDVPLLVKCMDYGLVLKDKWRGTVAS